MHTIRVLVVDNNPVIVRALTSFLAKEGCTVLSANDGLEALTLLETHPDIDILFTDLVMPFVEGHTLCKIVQSKPELSHIFLVIFSALDQDDRDKLLSDIPHDLSFKKTLLLDMRKQVQNVLSAFARRQDEMGKVKQSLDIEQSAERALEKSKGKGSLDRSSIGAASKGVTTELLHRNNYLTAILDNLEEGVVELNSDGVIIGINQAAQKFFGIRKEKGIGRPIQDICPWAGFQADVMAWLSEHLKANIIGTYHIKEEHPLYLGDYILTVEFSVSQQNDLVIGLVFLRDITAAYHAKEHQKRVFRALGDMRKMEAMRDMAGGFAHDFNNLLTAICGNLDILLISQAEALNPKALQLITRTREVSELAVDLTEKISSFSDYGIIDRQQVEMQAFVRDICAHYFGEKHRSYTLIDGAKGYLEINRDEIKTVIENIFENALEAQANDYKPIHISSAITVLAEPIIARQQYIPSGVYYCLSIQDYGIGIFAENFSQIFEPYFSTKERGSVKGSGLGLPIVYSFMRSHNGYVDIKSEENIGTTVNLYFPPLQDIAEELCENNNDPWQIIVVERDRQLRETCKVMLQYFDLNVTSFASEQEAFEQVTAFMEDSSNSAVDLVATGGIYGSKICLFMDMSNLELGQCAIIKRRWNTAFKKFCFIGSSSVPDQGDGACVLQNSIDGFITKPYSLQSLNQTFLDMGILTDSKWSFE